MKIALYTANLGRFDKIHAPVKQNEPYELHYMTENDLPFPLSNMDNRTKGRYLKTQPHTYIGADLFIWVDASVEIIDGTFIKAIEQKIYSHDMVCSLHEERESAYEELDYLMENIKAGKPYLVSRYAAQPFLKEYQYFENQGLPKSYPLYNGYFFAIRNTHNCIQFLDDWWGLICQFTNFDQSELSFAAWKNSLSINTIKIGDYIKRHKHL